MLYILNLVATVLRYVFDFVVITVVVLGLFLVPATIVLSYIGAQ